MRKDLLTFKKKFFKDAQTEANRSRTKGYVFGNNIDQRRTNRFIEILQAHQIDIYNLKSDLRQGSQTFSKANSYIIPSDQQQFKLIKSIFEKVTTFKDSLFYDVSAWTLPLAFDLEYAEITGITKNYIGQKTSSSAVNRYRASQNTPYAFTIDWSDYGSASVLHQLKQHGVTVRISQKEFTTNLNGQSINHALGTLVVPAENQPMSTQNLRTILQDLSEKYQVNMSELESGLTSTGFSLGSPSMSTLDETKAAILVGPRSKWLRCWSCMASSRCQF